VDADHSVRYANPAAAEAMGYGRPADLLGTDGRPADLLGTDGRPSDLLGTDGRPATATGEPATAGEPGTCGQSETVGVPGTCGQSETVGVPGTCGQSETAGKPETAEQAGPVRGRGTLTRVDGSLLPVEWTRVPLSRPGGDAALYVFLPLAEPVPAEPTLAEAVLAEPVLAEPVLAGPVLAEPLVGPVLAEPAPAESVLAEPALADPAPAEPVLAEPALAGPAPADPALAEPAPAHPALADPAPAEPAPSGRGVRDEGAPFPLLLAHRQVERQRQYARTLQHTVQERIVGALLGLSLARQELGTAPARAIGLLHDVARDTEEALAGVREVTDALSPGALRAGGLPAALAALARRCPVPMTVSGTLAGRLPRLIEAHLYLLVAEAVERAVDNGRAGRVRVTADLGASLVVTVVDDGAPPVEAADLAALAALTERAAALDGTLKVRHTPGTGTAVTAVVPL
jgi:hypothetical protein